MVVFITAKGTGLHQLLALFAWYLREFRARCPRPPPPPSPTPSQGIVVIVGNDGPDCRGSVVGKDLPETSMPKELQDMS